jgi:hypothetical protein
MHQLDESNRARCFRYAGDAIDMYSGLLDIPMMTYDVVWRYALIQPDQDLQKAYRAALTLSNRHEEQSEVALWVAPTIAQFCFAAELIRRQMWSTNGKEQAEQVGRLASDKIGSLSLGRTPLK